MAEDQLRRWALVCDAGKQTGCEVVKRVYHITSGNPDGTIPYGSNAGSTVKYSAVLQQSDDSWLCWTLNYIPAFQHPRPHQRLVPPPPHTLISSLASCCLTCMAALLFFPLPFPSSASMDISASLAPPPSTDFRFAVRCRRETAS